MRSCSFFTYVVLINVVLFAGCASYNLQVSEVPGTYKMIYDPPGPAIGCDTLTMKVDGTYRRVFAVSGERNNYSIGKWSFDNTADTGINFKPFVENIGPKGEVEKSPRLMNVARFGIRRNDGTMEIVVNDDLDVVYRKIP